MKTYLKETINLHIQNNCLLLREYIHFKIHCIGFIFIYFRLWVLLSISYHYFNNCVIISSYKE